jgi:hypothetical protein
MGARAHFGARELLLKGYPTPFDTPHGLLRRREGTKLQERPIRLRSMGRKPAI